MTTSDLIKRYIKRQILLPVSHSLALENNKVFRSLFSWLLKTLPFSEDARKRLNNDFLHNYSNIKEKVATGKQGREDLLSPASEPVSYPPVRLIAFYLPQFHAIPENNEWWGEGFTEWTNVKSAKPQFTGHNQPLQPGELGYYNLDDIGVMKDQTKLAKHYGINGFCFYFYWFAGKRLLEKPILQYLEAPDIEQPFCLCWANENWSRRWDGLHSEILIAQDHSAEDDLAFIEYISKYLNDPRYIRINNKPLLLVYRPSLLPAPQETSQRWRNWCRNNGIGEIYLAYTQSFESLDPKDFGFDAAIEFPPNNSGPPLITESVPERNHNFTGKIYDWSVFPQRSEHYNKPDYTLFRGVCPSWDNTARLKSNSTIFINNSPAGYEKWLSNAVFDTVKRFNKKNERFVFVNAWNEWAEGACLEPDQKFGKAYLEATHRALINTVKKITNRRIILVSHDAHPHGAQYLVLNMAKMLHESMGFIIDLIVLGEGVLIEEYKKYANVHALPEFATQNAEVADLLNKIYQNGARSAIVNSAVSGLLVPQLKQCGFFVISLVHELPKLIEDYQLQSHIEAIASQADKVVFAASAVRDGFESFTPLSADQGVIRPQGLYKKNKLQSPEEIKAAKLKLRKKLRIPKAATIVLAVGFADYRKGIDIFVDSGLKLLRKDYKAYFVWLGNFDIRMEETIKQSVAESGFKKFFIFPGLDYDTDTYYAGADIYALTSREDPFPSVVMEALDARTPVISFTGSGGSPELLVKGGGVLVDEMTSQAFSTSLMDLLNKPDQIKQLGDDGKKIIDEEFSFRHYLFDLLDMAQAGIQRVSVIVPNYNYDQYIEERLQSIIKQDYPIYEIIVLDDASTDNSLAIINKVLANQPVDYRIIANKDNSGSVFRQWQMGVGSAKGSHVWIAEADDSCGCDFVDEVMPGFDSPGVVLSYCESKQVDGKGNIMADNYHEYVADVDPRHWLSSFVRDGHEEIIEALSVKNTIPNVSGVVFKKNCLKTVLNEHIDQIKAYMVAGDWLVYVLVLKYGKIAFSPMPLNFHRRHQQGVTIGNFNEQQLNEIRRMQDFVREEFDVSDEMSDLAGKYIETLKKQFKITT
jgi:glycosyltransferase involved in cell wall biosynthesis